MVGLRVLIPVFSCNGFEPTNSKHHHRKTQNEKKGFSANAWQRTLTHKRTSSTALQDGSLLALVTWESRPGHLLDACRAPPWKHHTAMGHAQASRKSIISGMRHYLCRQRDTHIGIKHQPPTRNTTDTQQERRFLPRASRVRHGELEQRQPPMRNTTETQPERRFWPRMHVAWQVHNSSC